MPLYRIIIKIIIKKVPQKALFTRFFARPDTIFLQHEFRIGNDVIPVSDFYFNVTF